MNPPVVFMFSGQGSQYHHMGRALFETDEVFRHWMLRGDAMVTERTGRSVIEGIYRHDVPRGRAFDDLRLSHPAIFLVEVAMAKCLRENGIVPSSLIGSSLGVFAAWAVSGCLSFELCLEAVIRQADAVADHCPPGGMLAILGDPAMYHDDPAIHAHCDLAAVNFRRHFVVSGRADDLDRVARHLQDQHVPTQRLAVRYAFHSRHLEPAAAPFRRFLEKLPDPRLGLPVLTTVAADPGRHTLWEAVREPTHFHGVIQALEASPHVYVDVGPSGTLATFLKYILPPGSASQVLPTLVPTGQERANLERLFAGLHALC